MAQIVEEIGTTAQESQPFDLPMAAPNPDCHSLATRGNRSTPEIFESTHLTGVARTEQVSTEELKDPLSIDYINRMIGRRA